MTAKAIIGRMERRKTIYEKMKTGLILPAPFFMDWKIFHLSRSMYMKVKRIFR